MIKVNVLLCGLLLWGAAAGVAAAEKKTFAEKSLVQKDQLRDPLQVTVGPSDNFQGVLSGDGKALYYTQSVQMAKHIYKIDVETGLSTPVFDLSFDTRDPVLSPDGSQLAFTSYRKDARGDICVVRLGKEKDIRWLTGDPTEDRSPFWIDRDRLGFLSRDPMSEGGYSLMVYTLSEGHGSVVETGAIFDPKAFVSADGQWIVYVRADGEKRSLELLELMTGKKIKLDVELPGFPSFPAWSVDGRYLYFGQYALDTNSDQVVDANDRSAVYRIDVGEVLQKKAATMQALIPDSVTSLEFNCNYPHPSVSELWVTCSFRGSLDLFRLPLSGMLPSGWDVKRFERAIQTARTYEERIFLLEAVEARFSAQARAVRYRSLLSSYLLADQLSAARFYIRKLTGASPNSFFDILDILVSSEQLLRKEPPGRLSMEFVERVKKQMTTLQGLARRLSKDDVEWGRVAEALLWEMIREKTKAQQLIKPLSVEKMKDELALYYYERMVSRLFPENRRPALKALSLSKILVDESQVFYAYHFMTEFEKLYSERSQDQRKRLIDQEMRGLSEETPLYRLLKLDGLLNSLSENRKSPENMKVYNETRQLLIKTRSAYFLQRAMLVRSILLMLGEQRWQYMYDFAGLWLDYTSHQDLEYAYARKQFLTISLEIAYGRWGNNEISYAGDEFYIALGLTDDLEAHHGFIRARVEQQRRGELDSKYANMVKEGSVSGNIKYVHALLAVFDHMSAKASRGVGGGEAAWIGRALADVEKMPPGGFNPAVRFLLLGYLYHQQFKNAYKQGTFDQAAFEAAHHNYMLAYDLGRENPRVVPGVLFNLGLLHQIKHNYGESRSFFELRKALPFADDEWKVFVWYYGKTLFETNDAKAAFELTQAFVTKNPKVPAPFFERTAFYALHAGLIQDAVRYYEEYFKRVLNQAPAQDSEANRIRINMGYAYALFKNKQGADAHKRYQKIWEVLLGKPVIFSDNIPGQRLGIERYQLVVLGYLAQLEKNPNAKRSLLQKRYELLKSVRSNLTSVAMRDEDWLRAVVLACNEQAKIHYTQGQTARAFEVLLGSLTHLKELWQISQNPLDPALLGGFQNLLVVMLKRVEDGASPDVKAAGRVHEALKPVVTALGEFPTLASLTTEIDLFDPRVTVLKAYAVLFQAHCLKRSDPAALDSRVMREKISSLVADLKAQQKHALAARLASWLP